MPIDDAAQAVEDFAEGPAHRAADQTAKAFEAAGDRISRALSKAALSGEFSFNNLAESVTRDLARLAINDLLLGPLQSAIGGGVGVGGGRNTTVNMNLSGVSDARSFQRSQSQISASLARAVQDGQRYI